MATRCACDFSPTCRPIRKKSVIASQIFPRRSDLLHDFSGPTNLHDKSQRVNRPLLRPKTLRERLQGHSSCSYCQANRCKENHKFNTSVKIRNGRQRAFHLLPKVSPIEEMLEAPRAGGPMRVGLCGDSAPFNSTP